MIRNAYCAGDSVNNIDPTGHSWLGKKWKKIKTAVKKVTRKAKAIKRTAKKTVKRTVKVTVKKATKAKKKVAKAVKKTYKAAKRKVKAVAKKTAKAAKKLLKTTKKIAKDTLNKGDKVLQSKHGSGAMKGIGRASVAYGYGKDVGYEIYKDVESGASLNTTVVVKHFCNTTV